MRLLVVNIVVLIRLHTSRLIKNLCDKMFVKSFFRGEASLHLDLQIVISWTFSTIFANFPQNNDKKGWESHANTTGNRAISFALACPRKRLNKGEYFTNSIKNIRVNFLNFPICNYNSTNITLNFMQTQLPRFLFSTTVQQHIKFCRKSDLEFPSLPRVESNTVWAIHQNSVCNERALSTSQLELTDTLTKPESSTVLCSIFPHRMNRWKSFLA